jgi:hypothetical protein
MLSEYEFAGVRASESRIPSDLAHWAALSFFFFFFFFFLILDWLPWSIYMQRVH